MKNVSYLLPFLLALTCYHAFAQNKASQQERRTVAQVLHRSIAGTEREFTGAAEAMPEDKFEFAPTNGEFKDVRTFAEQIKHVAAVNYVYGAAILGEKVPDDETGPVSVKTKGQILKYLKESFDYLYKAVDTIDDKNLIEPVKSPFGVGTVTRLGIATSASNHVWDHYGQMVEYLRMNNIVPPASR